MIFCASVPMALLGFDQLETVGWWIEGAWRSEKLADKMAILHFTQRLLKSNNALQGPVLFLGTASQSQLTKITQTPECPPKLMPPVCVQLSKLCCFTDQGALKFFRFLAEFVPHFSRARSR